jgi:hypothetical protein
LTIANGTREHPAITSYSAPENWQDLSTIDKNSPTPKAYADFSDFLLFGK